MTKSGTTATFAYNADGLRVRKTVGSTVTNYTLHGKNIVHMTQGSNTLHFWYDAQNRPAIVQFNGTKYGYIVNLQGDVIGLIDTSGNEVVKYVYDAWGKILSTTGSLASTLGTIQPFRYRSYVYDQETGLYYLRSRYFNPILSRFINIDAYCGSSSHLLSQNLFAYCRNKVVNYVDYYGQKDSPCSNPNCQASTWYISVTLSPEEFRQYACIFASAFGIDEMTSLAEELLSSQMLSIASGGNDKVEFLASIIQTIASYSDKNTRAYTDRIFAFYTLNGPSIKEVTISVFGNRREGRRYFMQIVLNNGDIIEESEKGNSFFDKFSPKLMYAITEVLKYCFGGIDHHYHPDPNVSYEEFLKRIE